MKLRTLIIISVATVIIVGAASFAVGYHFKHRYDPVNLASVKKDGSAGEKCVAANKSIKIPSQARQPIANAAVKHIKDLPAGTKADVAIATYEEAKKVTGHVAYNKDTGSYNFTLEAKNEYWRVTSFKACE